MRRGFALVFLTLAGGVARADEPPKPAAPPAAPAPVAKPAPPLTPEQAANAVLGAVKAKDDEALKELAARDAPDPWLVADELIRRGEFDTADSLAKAVPRKDVEKLPEYVASRRGKPDDAAARSALAAANASLAAQKPKDALDALGLVDSAPPADVVGVRRAMGRGAAFAALGRLKEGAAAFLAAADAAERAGWLSRASSALHESGMSAVRRSDFRGALSAWESRREIDEARGDRAGAATTLGNIGAVHRALGDYAKALSTQERALAAQEAVGDRAGAARTLGNIGNVCFDLGDFAKALSIYERALVAKEALGDKAGAADTLGNIGNVHLRRGDSANALSIYERALAAQEAVGNQVGVANTLNSIGNVHFQFGDYGKALSIYERVLAAQEALGDRAGAARTLGNIGYVQERLGEYAKALATNEHVLAAKEALGDRAGAATTLVNIGIVWMDLGDFAKALSVYEGALVTKEALGDKAGAADALGEIGNVHLKLGDSARALSIYERALAAQEAVGNQVGVANTLNSIGNVYYALGDFAKALSTQERSLAALEALGDKARAANALGDIGNAYYALGDFAKALSTQERALAALEALGDRAGVVRTLDNIGYNHFALGDSAKAKQIFERAGRAAENLGAIELQVVALRGLAEARLATGDAGSAIESAHKAVSLLTTLVGGLGEEQGATARAQYASLFSVGLRAAAKANDAPEAAFFVESGRAGTLLESLNSRGSLRAALLPENLRVADVQARVGEARALVAYTKARDGGDLAAIRARDEELKAARAGVVDVVERIQREAKRAAQVVYPVAAKVEEIQRFLAAGDALVLYGLAEKDEIAHALVLTHDEARIVALGKSSQTAAACEALDPTDRDADPAAALDRLRDLVVKPLGLAKETKRLLVSPDGPLSYVPFAALAPDLVVAYEASGTTYGVLREEKEKHGEQVLALADADYTAKFNPIALDVYAPLAAARAPAARGGRLVPLPGTREEAMAVADVKLFGKDASESGLRAALVKKKDRWHSVHFACHGLVNPDRPTLSSLALTPEGENDGFLTALEVLKMEIPADLVVLSACETGKGKIVGGEGIVGLTRAFMYAGSPRVICSLWKVDDEATKALMVKFYELWNPKDGKPGLPTAEALRQAQEFVKSQEKWKHPYFWAAWVLWGLPE